MALKLSKTLSLQSRQPLQSRYASSPRLPTCSFRFREAPSWDRQPVALLREDQELRFKPTSSPPPLLNSHRNPRRGLTLPIYFATHEPRPLI